MKNKATILLSVLLVIAISAAAYFAYKYFMTETKKEEATGPVLFDLARAYQDYGDEKLALVFEGEALSLTAPVKKREDSFYFPLEFITQYLTKDLFYDPAEKMLTYTDNENILRMKAGESAEVAPDLRIAFLEMDGTAYLPVELLAKFANFQYSYYEKYHLLTVDAGRQEYANAVIAYPQAEQEETENKAAKKKALKKDADIAREYFYQSLPQEGVDVYYYYPLQEGMRFRILDELTDFYRVRSAEGFLGFIRKNMVASTEKVFITLGVREKEYLGKPALKGKVNLGWHQVFNTTANQSLPDRIAKTEEMNVISPTWFHIVDTEGTVSSLADIHYVKTAKKAGLQVWPLFTNSFDKKITHAVLSSTAKRQKVIDQIMAYVKLYELDGINVDFEEVPKEDGAGYVQFVKEIALQLRKAGAIVSVDMYVPKPWTAHYGRSEIAKYIDYLIIMGYDEHWSTSPKSGSVASIGFVREGVEETLKLVPMHKVILGVPFYTRLWKETKAGKVSSKAYGMGYGKKLMLDKGAELKWDEEVAQYYGEYKEGDDTYKMWVEDKRSLEEKLRIAAGYRLAGIAGWKLGLESDEAWEAISEYMKK